MPLLRLAPHGEPDAQLSNEALAMVVYGPARSGKSTTLTTIAAQHPHHRLCVVAPRRSPLTAWAHNHNVHIASDPAAIPTLPTAAQYDLIIVDDTDAYPNTEGENVLCDLITHRRACIVFAARTEAVLSAHRGILAQLRNARTGLILHARPADDGIALCELNALRTQQPPGRGQLFRETDDGARSVTTVQVASYRPP
jgi:hypothetical protein